MKRSPPSDNDLSRIYYELGNIGARAVGAKKKWRYHLSSPEELFTLASDLSRWDPRLLEILVQFGMENWVTLQPQKLRQHQAEMETPQTLGVIQAFLDSAKTEEKERSLFWDYVVAGLKPVEPQFYFRDLYAPGSRMAERALKESLSEFRQWGFLGNEKIVIDPATKKMAGTQDSEARLNLLGRLFKERQTLQISDYLEELGHSISRQQALLDLKASGATQQGRGRGAYWIVRPH